MTVLRRARDELQEKRPGSGSLRQDERYAKCCSNEVKAVARGSLSKGRNSGVTTLKEKWFWYSVTSAFCWAGFAISARFGSRELPVNMMQFVAAFGFLAFGLVLFATRGFHLESNKGLLNNNIYNS